MKTTILVLLTVVIWSSCKKEEKNTPEQNSSKKTLLIDKNWKVVSITLNPGITISGGVETNAYSLYQPCEQDNLIKFNENGTITVDEGVKICYSNDPQTYSGGSWSLNAAETILTTDNPFIGPYGYSNSISKACTITELSATSLKITYTDNSYSTSQLTTVTLVAQ